MNNKFHSVDSDLESAVEFNGGLNLHDVLGIRAAVYGENDEADWYWIIKMKDGTWGLGQGGCDYTGWDCQSNFNFTPAKTMWEALKLAPEKEEWRGRKIRTALTKQIRGVEAFGVITGEDNQ